MAIKIILTGSEVFKEEVRTDYEKKKDALRVLINSYPMVIDRSVFVKTEKEKQLLSKLKRRFKNAGI